MIPFMENKVHHYGHVFMACAVAILVVLVAVIARIQLVAAQKREDEGMVPDEKLTIRNFFEIVAEKLYSLAESVMGKHGAEKYFPVVGALFIFIFVSNLIGIIPGLLPPTDNLNTTFALGVFVFLYYNYVGLRENGLAYLKHFAGPILWLAPLMLIVELASHVFRPISLGLRLRGNIMGDHVVLGIFNDLLPYAVPAIFYGIGLFVALVQAFVFCLMTMVYISLSASHDH
ncbi:MAG: ATP synthase F0 subunit A [Proteobacteria bacterium]|nr:ATP synthase F0 subunit A [Pseudomonadota bacterium]